MKALKMFALGAGIFILSGFGLNQWGELIPKGIRAYQTFAIQQKINHDNYWEQDYWAHHPEELKIKRRGYGYSE